MATSQRKRSKPIEQASIQRQPQRARSRYFGEHTSLKIEPLYDLAPSTLAQVSAFAQASEASSTPESTFVMPKPVTPKMKAAKAGRLASRRVRTSQSTIPSARVQAKMHAFTQKEELPAPARTVLGEQTQVEESVRTHILKPILLPFGTTGLAPATMQEKKHSVVETLKRWTEFLMRRLMSMLPVRARHQLTTRGQLTLAQLEKLYALLQAETDEDSMDLVALKVAFGNAYYAVMEDSRRHYRSHRGRESHMEDYQPHFDNFLRELP